MPNVQFDSEKNNQPDKDRGKMVNFIRDKLGVSGEVAQKIFVGVGIIALLVSLYFWAQFLL